MAILLTLTLAGCASAPPRSQPLPSSSTEAVSPDAADEGGAWDGNGGAPPLRNRGELLADVATQLLGIPYRFGGATREGFDCSGLVFYAHQQLGLSVPRTSREQASQAEEVKERKLERGDLVFFKVASRNVDHVGIYVGERRFVHAPRSGKPVTINSLDDEYYADRFSSAGRYWNQQSR